MRSINRVQLIGNLGKDAEIRYTTSGTAMAKFSMATNEKWEKDGKKEEKTEWHNIVAWGWVAEAMSELSKGDTVFIEGSLQTRSWEDQSGVKKYTTEIVVGSRGNFALLARKSGGDSAGSSGGGGYQASIPKGEQYDAPDDIPF